jgi:hypothetical protein
MKAIYFKARSKFDEEINQYLLKGWLVHSITPILNNVPNASFTEGVLIIFNTQGVK